MKSFKDKPAIVFAPAFDTPGRKDSSGAFKPEAQRLIKQLGCNATLRLFDNNRAPADRKREVGTALDRLPDGQAALVAFVCHGWKDGIQAGWNSGVVADLADRLRFVSTVDATIALYCCDTGRGDNKDPQPGPGGLGGFASQLFTALCARGFTGQLWAHGTEGHTTQNPFVRVFEQDETIPLARWAVEPDAHEFGQWRRLLASTVLRYTMLTCETEDELHAEMKRLSPLVG